MIDPDQGYWAQMPTPMKICAPLTVLMIIVGGGLMAAGMHQGILLIGTPLLIIGLRFFVHCLLEIGPQSIFGYTYDFYTTRIETAYRLPRGIITIGFCGVFFVGVFILYLTTGYGD